MKTIAIAALMAYTKAFAVEGEDCYYDDICEPENTGLWCSVWFDS